MKISSDLPASPKVDWWMIWSRLYFKNKSQNSYWFFAPKAHLQSSAKNRLWYLDLRVCRVMILKILKAGNGVRSLIRIGYKSLWSCYVYSIDGIRRGYARHERFGRLKMKLCIVNHTHFSEMQMRDIWHFPKITANCLKSWKSMETMENHVSTCSETKKYFSKIFKLFINILEFFGFDVFFHGFLHFPCDIWLLLDP